MYKKNIISALLIGVLVVGSLMAQEVKVFTLPREQEKCDHGDIGIERSQTHQKVLPQRNRFIQSHSKND